MASVSDAGRGYHSRENALHLPHSDDPSVVLLVQTLHCKSNDAIWALREADGDIETATLLIQAHEEMVRFDPSSSAPATALPEPSPTSTMAATTATTPPSKTAMPGSAEGKRQRSSPSFLTSVTQSLKSGVSRLFTPSPKPRREMGNGGGEAVSESPPTRTKRKTKGTPAKARPSPSPSPSQSPSSSSSLPEKRSKKLRQAARGHEKLDGDVCEEYEVDDSGVKVVDAAAPDMLMDKDGQCDSSSHRSPACRHKLLDGIRLEQTSADSGDAGETSIAHSTRSAPAAMNNQAIHLEEEQSAFAVDGSGLGWQVFGDDEEWWSSPLEHRDSGAEAGREAEQGNGNGARESAAGDLDKPPIRPPPPRPSPHKQSPFKNDVASIDEPMHRTGSAPEVGKSSARSSAPVSRWLAIWEEAARIPSSNSNSNSINATALRGIAEPRHMSAAPRSPMGSPLHQAIGAGARRRAAARNGSKSPMGSPLQQAIGAGARRRTGSTSSGSGCGVVHRVSAKAIAALVRAERLERGETLPDEADLHARGKSACRVDPARWREQEGGGGSGASSRAGSFQTSGSNLKKLEEGLVSEGPDSVSFEDRIKKRERERDDVESLVATGDGRVAGDSCLDDCGVVKTNVDGACSGSGRAGDGSSAHEDGSHSNTIPDANIGADADADADADAGDGDGDCDGDGNSQGGVERDVEGMPRREVTEGDAEVGEDDAHAEVCRGQGEAEGGEDERVVSGGSERKDVHFHGGVDGAGFAGVVALPWAPPLDASSGEEIGRDGEQSAGENDDDVGHQDSDGGYGASRLVSTTGGEGDLSLRGQGNPEGEVSEENPQGKGDNEGEDCVLTENCKDGEDREGEGEVEGGGDDDGEGVRGGDAEAADGDAGDYDVGGDGGASGRGDGSGDAVESQSHASPSAAEGQCRRPPLIEPALHPDSGPVSESPSGWGGGIFDCSSAQAPLSGAAAPQMWARWVGVWERAAEGASASCGGSPKAGGGGAAPFRRTESSPGDVERGSGHAAQLGNGTRPCHPLMLSRSASVCIARGRPEFKSNHRVNSEPAVLAGGCAPHDAPTASEETHRFSSSSSARLMTAGPSTSASASPPAAAPTSAGSKWMKVWAEAAQPTSADLTWYQQQQHAAEADSSSLGPHQLTLDRLALLNRLRGGGVGARGGESSASSTQMYDSGDEACSTDGGVAAGMGMCMGGGFGNSSPEQALLRNQRSARQNHVQTSHHPRHAQHREGSFSSASHSPPAALLPSSSPSSPPSSSSSLPVGSTGGTRTQPAALRPFVLPPSIATTLPELSTAWQRGAMAADQGAGSMLRHQAGALQPLRHQSSAPQLLGRGRGTEEVHRLRAGTWGRGGDAVGERQQAQLGQQQQQVEHLGQNQQREQQQQQQQNVQRSGPAPAVSASMSRWMAVWEAATVAPAPPPMPQVDGGLPATKMEIEMLPEHKLTHADAAKLTDLGHNCIICMTDFSEGEDSKMLPCMHVFHSGCVDEWLVISRSCPMCKWGFDADSVKRASACAGGF